MTEQAGTARRADADDRWVNATDPWLTVLALAFVLVLLAPLMFTLTPAERLWVGRVNLAIWAVFATDYLVRLYLAAARWQFVRTHVLDLLVVAVPFLRPLRLLRLVGLVGVFTRRAQEQLYGRATMFVISVAGVVMVTGAIVILDAERGSPHRTIRSFPDALWWAATTVTTVGYGDEYPTTATGRLVAIVLMLTGIALVGTLTAAIATWFVGKLHEDDRVAEEAEARRAREERSTLLTEITHVKASLAALHARLDASGAPAAAVEPAVVFAPAEDPGG